MAPSTHRPIAALRRRFELAVNRSLEDVAHDGALVDALASVAGSGADGTEVAGDLDPGRWAISDALVSLLEAIVMSTRPRNVLEFGAGRSTRTIAEALARIGGGALTSIEADPTWCEAHTMAAQAAPGVDYHLIPSTLSRRWTRLGLVHLFDSARKEVASRGPFDMLVVDAPQYWLGRDGALPLVHEHLRPGALLLVDDAGREGERACLYRWLRTYRGLRLIHLDPDFGGRGLAALRFLGPAPVRITVPGFITATRLALTAARRVPDWTDKASP